MAEDNNGWSAFYFSQNKDKKEMKIWFDRKVLLGLGAFGTVVKGKFGGREVAVKRVQLHHVDTREEEAMLKLDHPNIVKLLHCESDDEFRNYALEICDASLDKLFLKSDDPKKYNGPMPLNIEIFHQLAVGLAYIHSENLIHRDIKPENILISVRSTGQGNEVTIKWADFGLSKPVNERGTYTLTGIRGTINWLAPESLKLLTNPQPGVESRGTVKSDVFVLGLVYGYLFLKGQHLYGNESDIYQNIVNKKDPVNMHNINGKLRQFYENDLLRKMLEDDPQKRITSKEVVEQLKSIKKKLTEKEEELRRVCRDDSSSGLIEKINDLIQLGIDVNAKDKWYGQNALHDLCRKNSNSNLIDAIRLLIQLGIDVNAKDNDGWNSLHYLCSNNSNSNLIDAIRLLIQLGIPIVSDDYDARSILHLNYRIKNKDEILKLLDEAAPV